MYLYTVQYGMGRFSYCTVLYCTVHTAWYRFPTYRFLVLLVALGLASPDLAPATRWYGGRERGSGLVEPWGEVLFMG